MKNVRCWLFGCRGHVDREIDADGIEWIGLRCVACGKLQERGLSNPDGPPVSLAFRPKPRDQTDQIHMIGPYVKETGDGFGRHEVSVIRNAADLEKSRPAGSPPGRKSIWAR